MGIVWWWVLVTVSVGGSVGVWQLVVVTVSDGEVMLVYGGGWW